MKLGGKDMLRQAQPHFETFKALFTHGVLGISRAGRPIWVMRVGILHLCPSNIFDMCALLPLRHNGNLTSAFTAVQPAIIGVLSVAKGQLLHSFSTLGTRWLFVRTLH